MDMTPEFVVLAFTLILAIIQIAVAGAARTAELGVKWNAGPRDEPAPPPGKLAGRLMRAQANLFETLPLFIGAVIMAHLAGKDGGALTLWGTHLYLFARVLYVPLYALGVTGLRTLAFIVSLAGLIMVIAALFV
ncbi:MAG: hypothetical protein JWR59_2025 [Brevundimonas sp.]|nr:hypothetical protein [Brevundimonas sp.]